MNIIYNIVQIIFRGDNIGKKLVIIFTIILFTIAFTNRFYAATYANHNNTFFNAVNINQNESQQKLENDLLLSVFAPYISKAIENYYGELRQFDLWDAKIISIKRLEHGSFNFETTISVTTFKGPHNPPYGLEMVTIRLDGTGIHVVDFKHKDVPYIHKAYQSHFKIVRFLLILR